MKETLAVSCVIPMFNAAAFICEAIQSVLDQSYRVGEIIVVDDGSTDGSAELLKRTFPQVTCIHQPNAGAPSARNQAVRAANCELIALLDADDIWEPRKLERQVETFRGNPRLGASLTHMQNFWDDEVAHEKAAMGDSPLTKPQVGIASTLLARARAFSEVGLFNETLKHRDIQEWMVRAENGGWEVQTLDDVLVRRRVHRRNMSRNRGNPDAVEFLEIARAALAGKRAPAKD